MNIKQARQEIVNTVTAYLKKDENGAYMIPPSRQRPILLMGPPGIGKTAIVEQAAAQCGINLVSYTITHHTRQSAIGLPFISKKDYGGRMYSVTEYTMSEIIASVYDRIEKSGVKEGILFLDEINCVSETLAPTMLQFLQYKMFGTHCLPEGFIIVTAGNPPEYNKSVRDLDIVTLDRVRKIDIDVDFDAWKEYALRAGVHGSILSYLEIRKEHFYKVETGLSGKRFVTARGWEDLSRTLSVYESEGLGTDESFAVQFLQSHDIASDYASYYELYRRYHSVFRIDGILSGTAGPEDGMFKGAGFDEKLSLIGLLTDRLNQDFRSYCARRDTGKAMAGELKALIKSGDPDPARLRKELREKLDRMTEAGIAGEEEMQLLRRMLREASDLMSACQSTGENGPDAIRAWFTAREKSRVDEARETGERLTRAFNFLNRTFGEGQEMVIFLTGLTAGYHSLRYITECGNEAYYRYNRLLLLDERRDALRKEIEAMMV
ncbi:MAG: AAA family ATPase [Lachnospiraceae bacterium]|nr:AAA family ATPase [Lachnospiraceae bacterium]